MYYKFKNVDDPESAFNYISPAALADVYHMLSYVTPGICHIVLFGSSITTAFNMFSDLDIFVVYDNSEDLKKFRYNLSANIERDIDVINSHVLELNEFRSRNGYFVNNTLMRGLDIYVR